METARPAPGPLAHVFAWMGGLLFVLSLVYTAFRYAVPFGQPATASGVWGPVAIDVLLLSAFALHHSVFARERVRTRVADVVSSRLERSVYVWVASLMLIAVCALWRRVPGVAWNVTGPAASILEGLQIAGIGIALWSAAMIDALDLAGIRQLEAPSYPTEFMARGPYAWVRHPIYVGWFLMVFATPMMTATRLVFAIVSSAYLFIAIPFEERSLRTSTHGAYERYARQVRWKLVPGIF
jgi:protein-S-isoprenylcysteine O-methyltransferase Ste14